MTSATEPSSAPGAGREAIASCLAGSNLAPRSSRRGKPSRASTSRAWARTALIPSMMEAGSAVECARARSRLSTTGSHSLATAALVSASARLTWTAHLLRTLSRSARARRRRSSSSATRASSSATRASSSATRAAGSAIAVPSPASCAAAGPGSGLAPLLPAVWFTGCSLTGRELGVDHVIPAITGRELRLDLRGGTGRWRAKDHVDLLQLAGEDPQPVQRRIFLERLAGVGHQVLGPGLLVHGQRVAALGQYAFHLVGRGVELVAGIGHLAQPPVLVTVPVGVGDHPLHLGLVQVGALADRDPLFGPGVLVPGRYVQDPVRVDVEGDFDLRHPARGGPDVLQPEPAQDPVVRGAFPLPLQDHHIDRSLVSSAVLNTSVRRAGIVVLRSITLVM